MLRRSKAELLGAAIVFFVSLLVYSQTLAPTVTLVDSGELIVAARFLGVAHPPGFPLYLMLAHLGSLVPIGNIAAGSKEPNKTKVGKVTRKQVMEIVKIKGKDLNSRTDEAGFRVIAGTARQMGLEIVD